MPPTSFKIPVKLKSSESPGLGVDPNRAAPRRSDLDLEEHNGEL